jgi:hypothetical protein
MIKYGKGERCGTYRKCRDDLKCQKPPGPVAGAIYGVCRSKNLKSASAYSKAASRISGGLSHESSKRNRRKIDGQSFTRKYHKRYSIRGGADYEAEEGNSCVGETDFLTQKEIKNPDLAVKIGKCFNILSLITYLRAGFFKNPFTNEPFSFKDMAKIVRAKKVAQSKYPYLINDNKKAECVMYTGTVPEQFTKHENNLYTTGEYTLIMSHYLRNIKENPTLIDCLSYGGGIFFFDRRKTKLQRFYLNSDIDVEEMTYYLKDLPHDVHNSLATGGFVVENSDPKEPFIATKKYYFYVFNI